MWLLQVESQRVVVVVSLVLLVGSLLPQVCHSSFAMTSHSQSVTTSTRRMYSSNCYRKAIPVRRNTLSMSAFGYCVACGTTHVLPTTTKAKAAALQLLDLMNETGRIDFIRRGGGNNNNNSTADNDYSSKLLQFIDPATLISSVNANVNSEEDAAKPKGTTSTATSTSRAAELELEPVIFPTTLLTEQRGKMMGVMVCEFGNRTVALCAFAGAIAGSYHVPGWVPPIGKLSKEWEETQELVSEMSNQMNTIQQQQQQQSEHHVMIENEKERVHVTSASIEHEWNRLREERARLSSVSLAILRSHQLVSNFKMEEENTVPECKTLEEIYMETMVERQKLRLQNVQSPTRKESKSRKRRRLRSMPGIITKGMPVGVGECCATKLLGFASWYNQQVQSLENNRGGGMLLLRPVGIAELFFGTSRQTQQAREPKELLETPAKSEGLGSDVSSSRTKQVTVLVQNDGVFFDACELRCQPVLGFMLCGMHNM